MDSLFGLKGADFVILAGETTIMQSIFKLCPNKDKSRQLSDNVVIGMSGETCQRDTFGPYIQGNLQYLKLRNGYSYSVEEIANFTRTKLAESMRKQPYQVNSLIAGCDKKGPQLFWLDYLGTLAQVDYGAHGHAGYFVSSVLSNDFKPDLNREEALNIIKKAILELKTRFLISQDNFKIQFIDKNGIEIIN